MVSEKINFLSQIFGIGEQNADNNAVPAKSELSEQFQTLLAQSLSDANKLDVAKKSDISETGIVELLINQQIDSQIAEQPSLNKTENADDKIESADVVINELEANVFVQSAVAASTDVFNIVSKNNSTNDTLVDTKNIVIQTKQSEIVLPKVGLPIVMLVVQQKKSLEVSAVNSATSVTIEPTLIDEIKPSVIFTGKNIPVQTAPVLSEKNFTTEKLSDPIKSFQTNTEKNVVQQATASVEQSDKNVAKSEFLFIASKETNVVSSDNGLPLKQDVKVQQISGKTDTNIESETIGKNNSVIVEKISTSPVEADKSEQTKNQFVRTRVDTVLTEVNESKTNIAQRIVTAPTVVTDAKRVIQSGANAQVLSELQTLERSKIKISSFEKGNNSAVTKQEVISTDASLKQVVKNISDDVKTQLQTSNKEEITISTKESEIQKVNNKSEKNNFNPTEKKQDANFTEVSNELKPTVPKQEKKQVVETLKQTVSEKPLSVQSDESLSSKFSDVKLSNTTPIENTSQSIRQTEVTTVRNEQPVRYSTALSEQWTKQVIDDIGKATSNVKLTSQSSEIRLKLHPEELGEISLTIKSENNKMNVTLRVNSSDVKDVLEKNLPMLQETFAQRGLEMRKIEIFNNNDTNSQSRNRDEHQQSGQERPKPQVFDEERAKQFERFFGYNTMEKTV